MKKLFLFVALTAVISFSASTFNSFASSNDTAVTANAPIYWQGWTDWVHNNGQLYITVYQSYGQCNAYYAVISIFKKHIQWDKTKDEEIDNMEVVVKYSESNKKYYVTFRGDDYFFKM